MTTSAAFSPDLLQRVREQLDDDLAEQLTFLAAEEPTIFCVDVLAKVRDGALTLPEEDLEELARVMRRL